MFVKIAKFIKINNFSFATFKTPKDYIKQCSMTFENLMEKLENNESSGILDINYSEGVLVINYKDKTFVINRQIPNEQIWYSSPISGPARFDFDEKFSIWKNSKQQELETLLMKELEIIKKK